MRSKADETYVVVKTLICPLQISQLACNVRIIASQKIRYGNKIN